MNEFEQISFHQISFLIQGVHKLSSWSQNFVIVGIQLIYIYIYILICKT